MVERDFIYSMQHPTKMYMTFTNDPLVAEAYQRAGYIIKGKSNTGNGSKIYKHSNNNCL